MKSTIGSRARRPALTANTSALTTAELANAHLRQALETRDIIGQAKGILMARRSISADQAFDILRRASQDLNVKIRDIASTIASRRAEI